MVVGEQGHGGVHHGDRAGHHAGAAAEAGEPVPLASIVALHPVRLVLADAVPSRRQGSIIGRPVVRAEQAHAPRRQAAQQARQRLGIAPAAFPVDQATPVTLERFPDPELAGFF